MVFVQDGIVEYQAGISTAANQVSNGLPYGILGNVVLHKEAVYGIMRKRRMVIGHIGLSVICERRQNELTVIVPSWLFS